MIKSRVKTNVHVRHSQVVAALGVVGGGLRHVRKVVGRLVAAWRVVQGAYRGVHVGYLGRFLGFEFRVRVLNLGFRV